MSALLIVLRLFMFTVNVSAQASPNVGRFFNPPNSPSDPANNAFSKNIVWQIGDIQSIQFTTTYLNYTIALWQQNLQGGSGTRGPIIFQTDTGAVTQFDWLVQTFQFNLRDSNVFFLWLHTGAASEQGNSNTLSITSQYINLTSRATTSGSTAATTSSTSIVLSSSPALSTTTSIPAAPSAGPAAATAGTSLPLGGQIGLGLGIAVFVILCSIGCWYFFKGRGFVKSNRDDNDGRVKPRSEGDLAGREPFKKEGSGSHVELESIPYRARAELDDLRGYRETNFAELQ